MTDVRTRRDVLGIGASVLAAGTLAGCLGTGDNGNTADSTPATGSNAIGRPLTATSWFAVLGDFASRVASDAAIVNTLVPVGQHGHGWSPSPRIQRSVLNSDLFIYMAEGFPPWADDIVTNINNGGTSVTVVEAREGIDLLDIGSSHDYSTDEHESEEGHDHKKGHEHDHGNESEHGHGATDRDTHAAHNETASHDHKGEHGHDEHEKKGEHSHENEHGHNHNHGGVDPHFWLDPHRSKQAVENIREGFITVDSSNAKTYADNAKAYTRRLDELDKTFASVLRDTPKDTVLVAGHNAFQYLGYEYGFEIEALTGLSPDDRPIPKDIAQAQEIITEHDIEYILAPVLESNRAATTLVQQTDATDVLPIIAIAGMTQEWQQRTGNNHRSHRTRYRNRDRTRDPDRLYEPRGVLPRRPRRLR